MNYVLNLMTLNFHTGINKVNVHLHSGHLADASIQSTLVRRQTPSPSCLPNVLVCVSFRADVSHNKSVRVHSFLCGLLGMLLPALLILSFVVNTFTKEELDGLVGEGGARVLSISTVSAGRERWVLPSRAAQRFRGRPGSDVSASLGTLLTDWSAIKF